MASMRPLGFQSLVRDSAHSDLALLRLAARKEASFNPSFGILPIQTSRIGKTHLDHACFNPSFGILPIQTT